MITIKWKKVHPDAKIPSFAYPGDAGADLTACEDIVILPGQRVAIPTGLQVEIPQGYELQIRPRSGLSLNTSLIIANSPGTVDSGYRGEVKVIIWNAGKEPYYIKKGDKIAQAVIHQLPHVMHIEVEDLSDTDRGSRGFGSSG